jgi:hypothetical protein
MMTETQQTFFRALCAPFEPGQVKILNKSGRSLHYITNRTLFNRLDNVAGPMGWYPEYRMNEDGLTCRLHIRVPDDSGEWVWMFKEDGGGFAGMASEEDNEKSGYSDAAKRAGMAWGIARYLYRDGVPDYLGDQPPPPEPPRSGPAPRQAPAREGSYDESDGAPAERPAQRQPAQGRRAATAPARAAAPARQAAAPKSNGGGGGGQYDNFKPPGRPGKAAYAWLKGLETHFGPGILKFADSVAKANGFPFKSVEWDEEQLETIAWAVIDEIRGTAEQEGWQNYQGEFDHLDDPRPE